MWRCRGALNLEDFAAFGRGLSLSIPERAKPGTYARVRRVLAAPTLPIALAAVATLSAVVYLVELLCTAGLQAVYPHVLGTYDFARPVYYGYLLLYMSAYVLDDSLVLALATVTLTGSRMQEGAGRWLKLLSRLVMAAPGAGPAVPSGMAAGPGVRRAPPYRRAARPLTIPPMSSIHTLLRESIDYAGLFPPAGLGMAETVANYAAYRSGPRSWALGRLVIPAGRLAELEDALSKLLLRHPTSPWRVAALLGADFAADLEAIGELNCRHAAEGPGALAVDVVEAKADTPEAAAGLLTQFPEYLQAYIEIPIGRDPAALAEAVAAGGGRLKVRTGGITPEAFPTTGDLLRFLRAARAAGVAFKATAGLHHPLRAEYRLTYEPESACGTMFGFLNLFLATALVAAGAHDDEVALLLEERDPRALGFEADGLEWRDRRIDLDTIRRARESGIVSFGSCSFTEPIGDLESLGLL